MKTIGGTVITLVFFTFLFLIITAADLFAPNLRFFVINQEIQKAASYYAIDDKIIVARIFHESSFINVKTLEKNGHYSYGLGQISLSTAKEEDIKATSKKLMDEKYNIWLTTRHMKRLLIKYKGNLRRAITAYIGGHGIYKVLTDKELKIISKIKTERR